MSDMKYADIPVSEELSRILGLLLAEDREAVMQSIGMAFRAGWQTGAKDQIEARKKEQVLRDELIASIENWLQVYQRGMVSRAEAERTYELGLVPKAIDRMNGAVLKAKAGATP